MRPSFTPKIKFDNVCEKIRVLMDVPEEFERYSLEVIFEIAMGMERTKGNMILNERDEIIDWLDENVAILNNTMVHLGAMFSATQSILSYFTQFTPLGACVRCVHSLSQTSINRRRKLLRSDHLDRRNREMIDSLIERFDLGKLDDETLKADMFFVLLACYEARANTLAMLFWPSTSTPYKRGCADC